MVDQNDFSIYISAMFASVQKKKTSFESSWNRIGTTLEPYWNLYMGSILEPVYWNRIATCLLEVLLLSKEADGHGRRVRKSVTRAASTPIIQSCGRFW